VRPETQDTIKEVAKEKLQSLLSLRERITEARNHVRSLEGSLDEARAQLVTLRDAEQEQLFVLSELLNLGEVDVTTLSTGAVFAGIQFNPTLEEQHHASGIIDRVMMLASAPDVEPEPVDDGPEEGPVIVEEQPVEPEDVPVAPDPEEVP
jgi:hypothetical protein